MKLIELVMVSNLEAPHIVTPEAWRILACPLTLWSGSSKGLKRKVQTLFNSFFFASFLYSIRPLDLFFCFSFLGRQDFDMLQLEKDEKDEM